MGFFMRARRRGHASRRLLILTALALAALAAYPFLHWSHVVLAGALLTVLYAAAVSLALPEQWEVTRHDVTLAMLWVAIACGTPLALASGLFVLAASAFGALLEATWLPPHRAYISTVVTATWTVMGILGLGIAAIGIPDPVTQIAAAAVVLGVLGLVLLQAGRRLVLGDAPLDLEIAAAAAALIAAALLAILLELPITNALAQNGRPLGPLDPLVALTGVVVATLLVVAAGAVRPFVPNLDAVTARLQRFVWGADPVPVAVLGFSFLDRAVTLTTGIFAFLEERAGVWVATVLIVALLVWSTR
jgi:hypothetical protein